MASISFYQEVLAMPLKTDPGMAIVSTLKNALKLMHVGARRLMQ